MVSRRNVLRTGGMALCAAVAGCANAPGSTDDTTTDDTTDPGSNGTTEESTHPRRILTGERVDAAAVPDGETVAVTAPYLHQLVEDAASADERVDLDAASSGPADRDETLALGQFEFLQFRGGNYEASTSFAGFAEEASYEYSLEPVDGEVDGDVLEYGDADLNENERVVVEELLDSGSVFVGHHEGHPAGIEPVRRHQYVRANGETRRILVTIGDYASHHMLTLDDASPGKDAQVVTVADRVPEFAWVDALRTAARGGDVDLRDVENADGLVEYVDDRERENAVDYVVTVDAVAEVGVVREVE